MVNENSKGARFAQDSLLAVRVFDPAAEDHSAKFRPGRVSEVRGWSGRTAHIRFER